MSKLIDLSGQTFGYLIVIEKDLEKEKSVVNKNAYWKCKCKCGNLVSVRSPDLRHGKTVSCGCKRKEKAYNRENLIGQKFNHLTVLELDETKMKEKPYKRAFWKCRCDCGSIISVSTTALKGGHSQSCGCIKSIGEEKIAKILSENNISFERQKSFNSCISNYNNTKYYFDFYLPNENILIEYDGQQHFFPSSYGWNNSENFKKIQQRDNYKNQWCKNHNIPLIRVPYIDFSILSIEYLQNKIKEVLL